MEVIILHIGCHHAVSLLTLTMLDLELEQWNLVIASVNGLYNSYDGEGSPACAFRPIITLNSNVQIDTANSGNGSTAEQAYIIK